MKGGTSGANVERKPSLIKDKGISATSRLVVTTTSASHSLQRPLSEKPSSSPPTLLSFAPRVPTPAMIHRGHNPTIQYDPTQSGEGEIIFRCVVPVFSRCARVRSRLNRPFRHHARYSRVFVRCFFFFFLQFQSFSKSQRDNCRNARQI